MHVHHLLIHITDNPISQYTRNIIAQDRYQLIFFVVWYHIKFKIPVVKACTDITVLVSFRSDTVNMVGSSGWWWWFITMDHFTRRNSIYEIYSLIIMKFSALISYSGTI